MTDIIKRCSSCGHIGPHGPNKAKADGLQTKCRECSQLRHVWLQMIKRCTDENHPKWKIYGGRGIKVCASWLSYYTWSQDMGPRPQGTSIERINNDGNYCPENCKWATTDEQANNKTATRYLTFQGETKTIAQWSKITGININTIWGRLTRGWTIEEAFYLKPERQTNEPIDDERNRIISLRTKGHTQKEIAQLTGYQQPSISRWLRKWKIP